MSLFAYLFHRKSDALPAGEFSVQDFCDSYRAQSVATTDLPETSQRFLRTLGLSTVPPFCSEDATFALPLDVPPMGPLLTNDHHESTWEEIVTSFHQIFPALISFAGLWLRVFASVVAPLCIARLLWDYMKHPDVDEKQVSRRQPWLALTCIFGVLASVVLTTDEMYVFESGGAQYGISLLATSSFLAFRTSLRHGMRFVTTSVVCLLLLTAYLVYDGETGFLVFGSSNYPFNVQEGFYYNTDNPVATAIAQHWPVETRTYSKEIATPWMLTGDARTGIPFFLNKVEKPNWTRLWLPTVDDEIVGLDVAFPKEGHDTTKPLYLVMHGLNGGSEEKYVKDLANRRTAEGNTVIVMVARGLMDLPVMGWNVFHGARVDDVHQAATVLRPALGENQIMVGIGYSMGAVVLSNYVARSGSECVLDAAMAISGGLDILPTLKHYRARRLWQPMLAQETRERFILHKFGERYKQRLNRAQMIELLRATDIMGIDGHAMVAYHGFKDIENYYSEMSAMGFSSLAESESGILPANARIHNVSIPLCVLHALEDPLLTWETVTANYGVKHPENLVKTGSGNLMLLLTKKGGHVGWPVGWDPSKHQWKWMSDAAKAFVDSVVNAKSMQH